ncbi:hypothetical protein BKA70DRAFT_1558010 [Coprinopsis sp. MPI-PUGE-AT-0042]|nr:hypothetical protein BKA70DRAFT_1558010 [Coprinopsis sp. MPI-PUGE-AT-0042]
MLRCALQCRNRIIFRQTYSRVAGRISRASYSTLPKQDDGAGTPGPAAASYWNPPPLPELKFRDKRTVVIKGWAPFKNMAEVLAVIREVERKFGSFVEYQAVRDYEMPDKYFGLIFAAFHDPRSFKAVPPGGIEMAVAAPPTSRLKHDEPGKLLGWDDIEKYLEPKERDPKYVDPMSTSKNLSNKGMKRMVYFRVAPSKKELDTPAPSTHKPNPELDRQDALTFLEWGRTLPLKPISSERQITDEEIAEGSEDLDHVRLRAALRWAARALGVPSPHEVSSEDRSTEDSLERPLAQANGVETEQKEKGFSPAGEVQQMDDSPTSKLRALFNRTRLGHR